MENILQIPQIIVLWYENASTGGYTWTGAVTVERDIAKLHCCIRLPQGIIYIYSEHPFLHVFGIESQNQHQQTAPTTI